MYRGHNGTHYLPFFVADGRNFLVVAMSQVTSVVPAAGVSDVVSLVAGIGDETGRTVGLEFCGAGSFVGGARAEGGSRGLGFLVGTSFAL